MRALSSLRHGKSIGLFDVAAGRLSIHNRRNTDGEEDGMWVTPLALEGIATSQNIELFNFYHSVAFIKWRQREHLKYRAAHWQRKVLSHAVMTGGC